MSAGFCPYSRTEHRDVNCPWCKAENFMVKNAPAYSFVPMSGSDKINLDVIYGKSGVAKISFDEDSDTGYFVSEKPILRDPQWRDVVQMFLDWFQNRPRKFFEIAVVGVVDGKEISLPNANKKP